MGPKKLESVKKLPVKTKYETEKVVKSVEKIGGHVPPRGMPSLDFPKPPSPNKEKSDLEFDALIAPKPVAKPVAKTVEKTGSQKTDSSIKVNDLKAPTDDDSKKISDEKVMSVKVTSPKEQELIEDTAEVASKAIENEIEDGNLIEKSSKPDVKHPISSKEAKEKPGKKSKEMSEKEVKSKPHKEKPKKEKIGKDTKEKLVEKSEEINEDSIVEPKEHEKEETLPRRRGR